ncbi:T9SS type A sorting domain-containing protein [candidate division KSB1 bacterium]|nr:T9SS type A sorting domain-containing protein [candidate division KSB1 bacterium]
MKKQRKYSGILAIILLSGFLLLSNNAVYSQPHFGPLHHPFMDQLTEEQRNELTDTVKQLREEGKTREEIRTAVDALLEKWGVEKPEHMGGRFEHPPFMDQLTEKQQTELTATVKQLRDEGKTHEEIRTAVDALLEKWGVEKPEHMGGRFEHPPFMDQLTEEQRNELTATVKQLRDEGKTHEEIRTAVDALLEKWGVEKPEHMGGRLEHPLFMDQLTEEQRNELTDTVKQLREEGKSREEIRTAVDALLEKWGVEKPEHMGGRLEHPPFMDQLTEEQQNELTDTVKQLREEGKSREEIRTAVDALLEKWGVEKPEHPPRHRGWREFTDQLTPEQRQQIHNKIKDMKAKDASREEIHQAVKALLLEFGVDLPEDWSDNKTNEPVEKKDTNKIILTDNNFPNPFNPETRISYTLNKPEQVRIRIYNVNGQLIRTLINEFQSPGTYYNIWNGIMDNGETASSGMYFYRIDAGGETLIQKMTLMK